MDRNAQIKNRTVCIACILLTGCSGLAISQTDTLTVDEVREQARQNELQRLGQDVEVQQQVQTRLSWLKRAETVYHELDNTRGLAEHHFTRLDGLLTSDEGKAIVHHGNHFITFILLKRNPPFSLDEIKLKVDEASGYLNQMRSASQGPEVGYTPSQALCDSIEKLEAWSKRRYEQLSRDIASLAVILRHIPQDIDLKNAETLAVAFDREQARPTEWHAEGYILGMNDAQPHVIATHQEATRLAEIGHASAASEAMLAEEQQKDEQTVTESKIKVLRSDEEVQTKHTHAQENHKDTMTELRILTESRANDRAFQWNEAQRQWQRQWDEDSRQGKICKALSARVQEVLAPFTAKSTYQHRLPGGSYDEQPISLNRLHDLGALRKDTYGLRMLTAIATDPHDKVRPRWPFDRYYILLGDKQKAYVREAQGYLLELGEILVELGYLVR